MSVGEIDSARLTAEEFVQGDEQLQHSTMLALAEYHEAPSFKAWCLVGGEPVSNDAERRYEFYHHLFIALWTKLGAERFFDLLDNATYAMRMAHLPNRRMTLRQAQRARRRYR